MKPELISFKLCPFVQRAVIVLREKGVDYDISYIDPQQPPDWFRAISPLGKVPLLRVGDTVLFESGVIAEYLDEVHPPSLHPAEPLRKAHNRGWIEFAGALLGCQFNMVMAKQQEACEQAEQELGEKLAQVERQLVGPFFNGEAFSLVDAAYAPLFMRLAFLDKTQPLELLDRLPRLREWSQRLLARPSVQGSAVAELERLYLGRIGAGGGYAASRFVHQPLSG